ncbi:cyclic beta 1-2 glucan synthetase [Clostridium cochlearium]|uniref:Cyclic beta 1-2 glucan synthetase n=1 Tax=Clostridium cochlearium TaxID=1494 RepID=A0A7Y3XXD3_CLOCO|nr:cyclic beta 1-2 glucan synthetase [Clostridium cochlearium]
MSNINYFNRKVNKMDYLKFEEECPNNTTVFRCKYKLKNTLDKSYKDILKGYIYLNDEFKNRGEIIPAGDWLLDNLYLIEKEYKNIKNDVREMYYRNIPNIKSGYMKCYPRIYYVAKKIVKQNNGKLTKENIEKYIEDFQKHTVLTSSELWALPTMLKIACINSTSKIVKEMVYAQKEKNRAKKLVETLLQNENNENAINDAIRRDEDFSLYFVEALIKGIRNNSIENQTIYNWINEKLDMEDKNIKDIILVEHKNQAFFKMILGNNITSIREVGIINWNTSFEKLSKLDYILNTDPANVYKNMDFKSKDYYRNKIERIAKKTNLGEGFIARKAIECAKENVEQRDKTYLNHVGYYIIDNGIGCLKEKLKHKDIGISKIDSLNLDNKTNYYTWFIRITTIILSILIAYYNLYKNYTPLWKFIVGVLILIIPMSEIVISILNWILNNYLEPDFIPKIEFKKDIPKEYSIMVVIPTLVNSKKRVSELMEDLEVYYLANRSENIYYGILADFKDSDKKEEEGEDEINKFALEETKRLNKKYSKNGKNIFYFFNRYRQFNEKQGVWLGWERKRGKLEEFNRLIRGDKETSYNVISGDIKNLYEVKYIITLDADTQLPMGMAKKLIGAMAHVLNTPYIDYKNKKVLRGYGLMQPRIGVGVLSGNKTLFSKIFSGETGIDTYTCAVSDIYQDLFGEGIFTGKGIYDVDIFNYMLKDEIPENSVLSHDLLEGSYVRTALVTDLELIDGYPAYYNASCKRLHRWVRGDWQLLPWIFKKNSLNKLSIWKMKDNLRRSLLTPSIVVLIILSLILFPKPEMWLSIAIISFLTPVLFNISEITNTSLKDISIIAKLENWKMSLIQFFLMFSFIPYKSYVMIDAISRSLYRMFISKKNLLEWQTAADVEAKSGKSIKDYIKTMWIGSFIAVLVSLIAFYKSTNLGLLLFPSCIIWFFSPCIAYYISKDIIEDTYELNKDEKMLLRRFSRKIWAYFEDFAEEESNWLVPDNYQEEPQKGVAYRTSPTNIGMGLIACISALDLGYINLKQCIYKVENIIKNMNDLERYEGHFYNWYDTKSKKPLNPKYISTVDSGNLIGYLWLLENTFYEFLEEPFINIKDISKGIIDLLYLSMEEIGEEKQNYIKSKKILDTFEGDVFSFIKILKELKLESYDCIKGKENLYWNTKLYKTLKIFEEDFNTIFPWSQLIEESKLYETLDNNIIKELSNLITKCSLQNFEDAILKIGDYLKNSKEEYLDKLNISIQNSKNEIKNLKDKIVNIIKNLNSISDEMNFKMLFDEGRGLFAIGYDVEKHCLDNCYYDLLASEARQASFITIAKGDIPYTHWFNLGRSISAIGRKKGLVSWSGTMFEYLMPLLIMKSYPNTLLKETYDFVVESQKKYGEKKNVPWGISESGFYAFDVNLNYQYKAFGVPGIGLKRGLETELVISPYSTFMALNVDYKSAIDNLKRIIDIGAEGRYGLYEAIDFTKNRNPKDSNFKIVKSFMVHHQGMSFMALNNILNNFILQRRFHRDNRVKSVELLLQEKIPKTVVYKREEHYNDNISIKERNVSMVRKFGIEKHRLPQCHFLSNGNYDLMITNRGSGYSKRDNIFINRWREDITDDNLGMFVYIKDIKSGVYWSNFYQPCKKETKNYEVSFSVDKAKFERVDGEIKTTTEICVSNEENGEIRKVTIDNNSGEDKILEITSYFEVVLNKYDADLVHPSFSNLFINTEFIEEPLCILANRRKRSVEDKELWIMQSLITDANISGNVQYETSRANFIGRCRDLNRPEVIENDRIMSNTVGAVLDPIISMRVRVKIPAKQSCQLSYVIAICENRQQCIEIADKYQQRDNVERVFQLAWTYSQIESRYLGIKSYMVNKFQELASNIIFPNESIKQREQYVKNIRKNQVDLWKYGISGDIPIACIVIDKLEDIGCIKDIIKAHEYWNVKGLEVDLIIINLEEYSYEQELQISIKNIIFASHLRYKEYTSGGVFLYNKSTMLKEDIDFIISISRLVIYCEDERVLNEPKKNKKLIHKNKKINEIKNLKYNEGDFQFETPELEYFNGFGGFKKASYEYIIILDNYKNTPAPWINVISNGKFGFHISENGVSYTWYKNSRENKLTPWSNDWVKDNQGEFIYLKDEETYDIWSISPKPKRNSGKYIIEHGFGYSTYRNKSFGIVGEMTSFVPLEDNVKVILVNLKNNTDIKREISVTYYAQLTLGVVSQHTSRYISTYKNDDYDYIYAKNPYNTYFGDLIAYCKVIGGEQISYTGDRMEFIGVDGSLENPNGLKNDMLSNTLGSGMDPCIAINEKVILNPDEEKTVFILLGQEDNIEKIDSVIEKYENEESVLNELKRVKSYWEDTLTQIQIETPDKSMDIMVNKWLLYQVISCRFWARTGFYQSGGAYGFRDQLQDSISISYVRPELTREHILYSASRQFLEGDVQHWWHPVVDSGIRTRFSDDLLWLPYVTIQYIKNTGDYEILNESINYLEDEPLKEGEDERYTISKVSQNKGSLYEHCIKAIDKSLKFGENNIPLMGSGDWNDGMSTVGNKGKGESVWLGWFIYNILKEFTSICNKKQDYEKEEYYNKMKRFIVDNIEKNAWDGKWYRRAYFDDGKVLGSAENEECQIDSLAQSWAVISEGGNKSRAEKAMLSAEERLVKYDKAIVKLLTPAFNKSDLEPGYIKGYVPGVRENGGQYTHAAIWYILALAKLGYGEKAWKIFNMINPINHTLSNLNCNIYKVEPYVMTADVYTVEPNVGRGGWSWYTGAAGWMYTTALNGILGFNIHSDKGFSITPNIPSHWNEFKIVYKKNNCKYNIKVERQGKEEVYLNNELIKDKIIPLFNQGEYEVKIFIK